MSPEPWQPGHDKVEESIREGDGPPTLSEGTEEPEVPDPNMDGMPTVWGYDDCNFDKKKKERPTHQHHQPTCQPVPVQMTNVTYPNEEMCRLKITEYVQNDCCLGKEPIQTMTINSVTPSNAFTYSLETFVEKRNAGYEFKPYKGGDIDDPSKGRAPEPWDMEVKVKDMFKDDKKKVEVPHTSTVRTCHHCCGNGYMRCYKCLGWGQYVCPHCSGFTSLPLEGEGEGERPEGAASCISCNDSHFVQCGQCAGDGRMVCPACDGYRAIRCFIQLKVSFKSFKEQYVNEATDLPDQLVNDVKGVTMFEQTQPMLAPVEDFPIPDINTKSQQFFNKHRLELLDKKRLVQQRQKLVAVPVTEVHVTWKGQEGRFWLYGTENKVYCPSYPDTCACCVII